MEKEIKKIKTEIAKLKKGMFDLEYRVKCNEKDLNNLKKTLFSVKIEAPILKKKVIKILHEVIEEMPRIKGKI